MAAKAAVKFYHGQDCDVESVLDEYSREAELCVNAERVRLSYVFKHKHLYMPFLLCIAIYIGYNFGGGDAVGFYSTHILRRTGLSMDAPTDVVYCNIPAVLISVVCMVAVYRWGRRPVVLFSFYTGDLATLFFMIAMLIPSKTSSLSPVLAIVALVSAMCSIHANEMVATILPGIIIAKMHAHTHARTNPYSILHGLAKNTTNVSCVVQAKKENDFVV